jgi:phytanoyl-CoA hydroxylase
MATTQGREHVSSEQIVHDGYVLMQDLISASECESLAERLQEYARGERTASGIVLQREPQLEQSSRPDGTDIRKIAGLHADDLFRQLINRESITSTMRSLVGEELRLYRADALMKPAGIGSEKGVHQDSPYWPVEPMSLWSCWMPFDDATIENGCMMVIPGSHLGGPRKHVRTSTDYVIPTGDYDVDALLPVPMRRGSGLFFHSLLIHGTAANISGLPRRAVTMSFMGPQHRYAGAGQAPNYPVVGVNVGG